MKTLEEREELYKIAKEKWETDFQDLMLVEECSELIQAICHSRRSNKTVSVEEIAGELADVSLLLEQFVYNHNLKKELEDAKVLKLKKLERYLGI